MMDYEKKYKDALERAKELIAKWTGKNKDFYTEDYAYIFPELAESEDERIRNCIRCLTSLDQAEDVIADMGFTRQDLLAWLEKQKEQKKPTLDDPDIYGDWDKDLLEEIHSWLGHLDGKYTPYTIDDIKLTARHFVEWQLQKEKKPAEWSEKDKKMLDRIVDILNRTFSVYSALGTSSTRPSCPTYKDEIDWLKSLRPSWKPSEEQMEALLWCVAHLGGADRQVLAELYEHLKMYCK